MPRHTAVSYLESGNFVDDHVEYGRGMESGFQATSWFLGRIPWVQARFSTVDRVSKTRVAPERLEEESIMSDTGGESTLD